jgi:hypothetical protein
LRKGQETSWRRTGGTAPGKMSTSSKSSTSDYGTIATYENESDKSSDISPHGNDYDGGSSSEVPYDRARRRSFIEEDEDPLQIELPVKKRDKPVTWLSLPHKSQLAILTIARLSEPLVQTSLRVSVLSQKEQ